MRIRTIMGAAALGAVLLGSAACEQTLPIPEYEKVLVLQTNSGKTRIPFKSGKNIYAAPTAKKGGG
jgi:hypothetical protein